jgi:osmotically-inducible protein OsmY
MTLLKRCSMALTAALLATALGCASTSSSESTGEYLDDSVITSKVKTAIFNEPTLKVLQINVETYKSVVQLSGFVASGAEMDKAGDIARSVNGVRAVKNDIKVK